jgi:hypothetical protein
MFQLDVTSSILDGFGGLDMTQSYWLVVSLAVLLLLYQEPDNIDQLSRQSV